MAKHQINDTVRHSRHGAGRITSVRVEMETPPAFDPVKLDGELWNLRARIAEIERIKARGTRPEPVDKYTVEFEPKTPGAKPRTEDYNELAIDKLKAIAERPPEDAAADDATP